MDSFQNMMKAACHIKSYQMSFDKKVFESLPEFYKTGLYCCEMMRNVREQKDFHLKKAAFEVHKVRGIELLSRQGYDDANYSFCKSLCIFKYIKNKSKNWKTEGIKDEDLEFFDEEGNTPEEKEEIKKMKVSALLNISLCDLNLSKFEDVRLACDEVLKLDPTNVKAFYRKAKSYLDCKASLHEDYLLAFKDIEAALKFDPQNQDLLSIYNSLKFRLDKDKQEEKKVFKSFFRNVNYEMMKQENEEPNSANQSNPKENNSNNFYTKVTEEDANMGKPEIRILNLVIEQSYVLIDRLEREGNRAEMRKLQAIVEKAKIYKEDLQSLLELNFEKPNDDLRKFAEKNNLDLNDPNVKTQFFKIRKDYLEQINKFYENNLLKFNPQDIIADERREKVKKIANKKVKKINSDKNASDKNTSISKPARKTNFNYSLLGILALFMLIAFYFIFNKNTSPSENYMSDMRLSFQKKKKE